MTARHLGERIHDLLDNRLSSESAAEAMAHLEECDECSRRWEGMRAAREALHSSEAGIDMRFTQQLLDRDRMAEIASHETRQRARAARGRDRRPAVLTLSLTLILVAVIGAAYVAGEPSDIDPGLSASSDDGGASIIHLDPAAMREGEAMGDWIHPDWQSSGFTPVEAAVREAPSGSRVLVYTLVSEGESVLALEQRGRLAHDRVAALPVVEVGGLDTYVVGTDPSRLVWQAGELVVALQCECSLDTLEDVAAQFPQDGEPSLADQIMTGLGVFGDALTGH
ncbi:anti-sigma factor family protein [Demequina phytophila]|uniref:anti-sigma factor family protein n=1 Tax=Demequina phytophila TaxID=1638981 RepID=UPI00078609E1|nr:zf-HC2 domain-containing protein [Demequina phytophila]